MVDREKSAVFAMFPKELKAQNDNMPSATSTQQLQQCNNVSQQLLKSKAIGLAFGHLPVLSDCLNGTGGYPDLSLL